MQPVADGESGLVLLVFGPDTEDFDDLAITVDAFRSLYGENRLPDGWSRPEDPVTQDDLTSFISEFAQLKVELGGIARRA